MDGQPVEDEEMADEAAAEREQAPAAQPEPAEPKRKMSLAERAAAAKARKI